MTASALAGAGVGGQRGRQSDEQKSGKNPLDPKYEEYLHSETLIEPDPRALALLDEKGRLRVEAAA